MLEVAVRKAGGHCESGDWDVERSGGNMHEHIPQMMLVVHQQNTHEIAAGTPRVGMASPVHGARCRPGHALGARQRSGHRTWPPTLLHLFASTIHQCQPVDQTHVAEVYAESGTQSSEHRGFAELADLGREHCRWNDEPKHRTQR